MAKSADRAAGLDYSQVLDLIDGGVSDERVDVAAALVRFKTTLAMSDLLHDDDFSAGAKSIRVKALARLATTRDMFVFDKADLAAYGASRDLLRFVSFDTRLKVEVPSQTMRIPSKRRSRGSQGGSF